MPLVIFVLLFTCSSDAFFDGVRDKYNNGFPESKYHQILNTFETIYGKKIQDLGGEFVIWRDWSDGAVNMWAEKWGAQYILEVPGGMARYHLISEEAFVLSVCHELGHLLGGEPKNGEISFEGQSDYFAGGQCIEEMLNSIPPIKGLLEDPDVLDFCRGLEAVENSLCQRVVSGAKSLSSYYAEILGVPFPQVTLSSGKKVSQTLNSHPEPQCRLDTFLAGFRQVPRPQCWYAGRFFF